MPIDHELLRVAVLVARLAVLGGERAVMQRDGGAQRDLGERASCRRRPRRGRRAPVRSRASVWTNTRRRSRRSAAASARGVAGVGGGAQRRFARRPGERRVERRGELLPLFRARGERRGRVAAVGEGGGEVGGDGHGNGRVAAGRRERAAGPATGSGESAAALPLQCGERLHYAFPARLPPRSPRGLPSRCSASSGRVVVVGFAAFALALLAVRFVVFPQIESYRDTLAARCRAQLGQPVEIAALTTGWDGWNPKLVVEGFRVLDRARAGADAAPRAARSRADRLVDVAAAARAAPEGARSSSGRGLRSGAIAPACCASPESSSIRRRRPDESAAHRLDPAPARDRHPRRADHCGTTICATRRSSCSTASSSAWRTGSATIASD